MGLLSRPVSAGKFSLVPIEFGQKKNGPSKLEPFKGAMQVWIRTYN
jgi:hypothetical protein